MIKRLLILFVFFGAVNSYSQNLEDLFPEEKEDNKQLIENVFKGTRLVNTQSANLAEPGLLILNIQHRFGSIKGGAYEFFGLDQAEMRLGFEYGLAEKLNVGIGRTTYQKTYDAFLKAGLAEQSEIFPFKASFTASGYIATLKNYFPDTNDDLSDKIASNFELEIVRNFKGFAIQVSPSYMFTGYIPEAGESNSFAILTGALSLAVSKVCTHQQCNVSFNKSTGQLPCPCHGSVFGTNGNVLNGPAVNPLKKYSVTLSNNKLTIK